MIEFRLQPSAGLSPYAQLVQQVRQAIRMGRLQSGDQLPTVREVVTGLAINPNTVLKAYRELELAGLVDSRQGRGTFISAAAAALPRATQGFLERGFKRWLRSARDAGLDAESIRAIVDVSMHDSEQEVGAA